MNNLIKSSKVNIINKMDDITEYSNLCDLVYNISRLNIKQDNVTDLKEEKENNIKTQLQEIKNPYILHFQEEYTDIDKILSSFDLREYVIPYSNYLTNIINNYLMEVMMEFMNVDTREQNNISSLIKFYHFSIKYIDSYYSYQKQLDKLSSFPDKKSELKAKAKLDMKNRFDYTTACDIYKYLTEFKESVNFSKNEPEHKKYTYSSKKLVRPIYELITYLLSSMENYIKDVNNFVKLTVNDRMDIIIPFMNIIQFSLYILVKNDN